MLAIFLDMVDGWVARAKKMESKKGAFLDGISDRIVEFFLLLSLLLLALPDMPESLFSLPSLYSIISILFFGTCMTSFVKAYADHKQVVSHEKSESMP